MIYPILVSGDSIVLLISAFWKSRLEYFNFMKKQVKMLDFIKPLALSWCLPYYYFVFVCITFVIAQMSVYNRAELSELKNRPNWPDQFWF